MHKLGYLAAPKHNGVVELDFLTNQRIQLVRDVFHLSACANLHTTLFPEGELVVQPVLNAKQLLNDGGRVLLEQV